MDKLAAWKAAPATANLPAAVLVSRDKPLNVPPLVVEAALRADASALPAFIGVDMGNQGYAVAKITTVVARQAPDEGSAKQEQGQYAVGWSAAEAQAYYNSLKEKYAVKFIAPKPARVALDGSAPTLQ